MPRKKRLAVALAALILTGCTGTRPSGWPFAPAVVPQQGAGMAGWTPPPAGYLTNAPPLDAGLIIGPPPAAGSARDKADHETFRQTRKLVNTPAWTRAIADADLSGREGLKSFSCAAGVTISPDATPTLARLLMRMTSDAALLYRPAKAQYQRPRPPVGNSQPICVPRESWIQTDGSYPSGHSLIGWSWALVIADAAPQQASQVLARGRAFGDSRVICGVHFPSDVEAGRYLGSVLVSRLQSDPAFRADLETARAEVAASRASGPPAGCGQ